MATDHNFRVKNGLEVGGNVGIGTGSSTLSAKLQVVGTAMVGVNDFGSYDSADGNLMVSNGSDATSILLYNDASVYHSSLIHYDTGVLSIGLNNANSTNSIKTDTAIYVNADGVGIGNSAPDARLHVQSNHSSDYIAIFKQTHTSNLGTVQIDTPTDNNSRPSRLDFARGGTVKWKTGMVYGDTSNGWGLSDATGSGTAVEQTRFLVQPGGNVGIGTNTPNAKLEIKGASSTNYLRFNNSSDSELFRIDSNFKWSWGTTSPAQAFDMRDNSGNALFSVDRANGKVGIGTTSPSTRLTVKNDSSSTSIGANNIITIQNANTTDNSRMGLAFTGNTNIGSGLALVEAQSYDQSAGHTSLNFSVYNGSWHSDMMVLKAGKVGIGTTSPAAPLDFGVTSTNQQVLLLRQNGNSRTGFSISNNYGVRAFGPADASSTGSLFGVGEMTSGTNYLGDLFTVQYDGKVGIGTTSPPHQKLTLTGASNAASSIFDTGILAITTGTGVIADTKLIVGIVDDDYAWMQAGDYGVAYRDIALNPLGGNVGIGTTNPQGLLHVKDSKGSAGDLWTQVGAGNAPSIHIQNSANTANTNAVLYFRNNVGEKASIGARFVNQSTGETELRFSTTNSSGTSRERVFIDGDGNLGIGTAIPSSPLHVYGSWNNGWLAQIINTGTGSDANGLDIHAGVDSSDYILRLREQDATDVMAVKYGGKVGIGTTSPQHELVVASTGNTTLGLVGSGYDDAIAIRFGGGDLTNTLGNGNSGAAIISQQSVSSGQAKGDLRFQVNGGDLLDTAMYIGTSGTVDVSNDLLANNAKLKAIAESNSDTAVDVFIYDTRKDSDGGAWRKRTQHTSWYNETLNTNVRGARKEFPSVAVIVAESNEVTIYDGDDPSMPMWMVFSAPNGGWSGYAMGGGTTISSVRALNATIAVGNSGYGLTLNNFISERSSFQENGYNRLKYGGLVARNNDMTISGEFGVDFTSSLHMGEIVHDQVYAVALRARKNAPIDPLTGLPALTIAVGTYQGINIFKDDATRITRQKAETSNHVTEIMFDGDDHYLYVEYHSSSGHASAIRRAHLDETGALGGIHYESRDRYFSNYDWAVYNHTSYGHDETAASYGTAIASTNDFFQLGSPRHIAGNKGLTQVFSSSESPPYTYNYITASYNTGWMFRDIKLATLSNTITTAYAAAVDGISAGSVGAGGTSSISGGVLTATSSSVSNVAWTVPITMYEGRTYSISMQRESGGDAFTRVYGPWSTHHAIKRGFTTTGSVDTITFTARSGGTSISLVGASANSIVKVSSISIREAEKDHSWNDKGFQVHGTVTKTAVATGASLVGYTGWSLSNYLEQDYNGDLNFGTGEYSIAVWVNRDSGSDLRYVYCRGSADTTETIRLGIKNSGIYFDYGNGQQYALTNIDFPNAVWTHVFCTVSAGCKGKVYVNGIEQTYSVNNAAPSPLMNAANYTSLIGRHYDNNNDYVYSGDIALLRISGKIASAEQIAKMYDDERLLFEPNAKAVLNASSNIDGIAYDESTELLHVGTASGRNTFQGLRRVDTTTDAITKVISASNGLIVEE